MTISQPFYGLTKLIFSFQFFLAQTRGVNWNLLYLILARAVFERGLVHAKGRKAF